METEKKITRVGGNSPAEEPVRSIFVANPESKKRATKHRVFAGILWLLAIGAQLFAITLLFRPPIDMTLIIILIAVDLALAIIGSILWKSSNRYDPPTKKQKFKFFMKSQLGLVVAVIAFLPLIIVILTNKNLSGKQKGILGGIAGAALVIAGLVGVDFNPPSIEE